MARLQAEVGAYVTTGVDVELRVLRPFAVQLMLAAARFARSVRDTERRHAGQAAGEFWELVLHLSTASVFAVVSSLEAYANELFFDREGTLPGLSAQTVQDAWNDVEGRRRGVVAKFNAVLRLRAMPVLDEA